MPRTSTPPLACALGLLRTRFGWTQGRLAEAAGLNPSTIRRLESGDIALTRDRLSALGTILGATNREIEAAITLSSAPSDELSTDSPSSIDPEESRINETVAVIGREAREFLVVTLRKQKQERERRDAARLWETLTRIPKEERGMYVENDEDCHSWAVVERLGEESTKAAARDANEAIKLADLALLAAQQVAGPGKERAVGFAWGFVANARRVANWASSQVDSAFTNADFPIPWRWRRRRLRRLRAVSVARTTCFVAAGSRELRGGHCPARNSKGDCSALRPSQNSRLALGSTPAVGSSSRSNCG
ncbi:MAG: helix-turn-helix transcriptional regulator [Nitrospira sp.]|nr:helix-turn-helix transcriptional regulator [Nitrospira sp.]